MSGDKDRRPKMVRTNVSQGTRSDAHGGDSLGELLAAEDAIRAERDALVLRRSEIDTRLAAITNRIRGNRLPPGEYGRLTAEQDELKKEATTIIGQVQEAKRRLIQISQDVQACKRKQTVAGVHDIANGLLRELLAEVRAIKARLPLREEHP